jgi:hypothetical protein
MGLDRPFISEIVRLKGRDSKHSLAAFEQAKLSRDGSRKALSNEVDRASSGLQNIFGRFKPEKRLTLILPRLAANPSKRISTRI